MASENSPPGILYHYTTQQGLLGILKEKALWVTNLFYLNDSSEYLYAVNLAKEKIQKKIDKFYEERSKVRNALTLRVAHEQVRKELTMGRLKKFTEVISLFDDDIQIFVCSFSEKRDHLGQWRGYCHNESGYSIGFDSAKLKKMSRNQDYDLEHCTYNSLENKSKISNLIKPLFESLNNPSSAETDFLNNLFAIAPTIKRSAFKEEYEWRLISKAIHERPVTVSFKEGKSMIIPYIKFSLGAKLPIRKIIVGPTPYQDLSIKSIRLLLGENELQDVEVIPSKIPYRNW